MSKVIFDNIKKQTRDCLFLYFFLPFFKDSNLTNIDKENCQNSEKSTFLREQWQSGSRLFVTVARDAIATIVQFETIEFFSRSRNYQAKERERGGRNPVEYILEESMPG